MTELISQLHNRWKFLNFHCNTADGIDREPIGQGWGDDHRTIMLTTGL